MLQQLVADRSLRARNGTAFTTKGAVNIKAGFNKADFRPIEEGCECYACKNFTRAYLRHLFAAQELLAFRLNSLHNLTFYMDLMSGLRAAIEAGGARNYMERLLE